MKQPSTLARKGPVRAVNLKEIRVFLYFSVLTFTWRTSRHNALARVSKSRVAGFRSDLSFRNRGYRIGRIVSRKKGIRGGDRATPKLRAMRNSPVGYKPSVPFRKTYGTLARWFPGLRRSGLRRAPLLRSSRQSTFSFYKHDAPPELRAEGSFSEFACGISLASAPIPDAALRTSRAISRRHTIPVCRRKA
jgi:hypothetical protein